jgi:glycerol-3-phosphate dehydrogenase (NAD(P)+)
MMSTGEEKEYKAVSVVGSGSWATALAKMLTDNQVMVHWYVRHESIRDHLNRYKHNPHYLQSASFDTRFLTLYLNPEEAINACKTTVLAVPSAYMEPMLAGMPRSIFNEKDVVSAIKGLMPGKNLLLNEYLQNEFQFDINRYFTVMGPCHAEEVASEKLSYLTFSGLNEDRAHEIADCFKNHYINTVVNTDIYGVQYAAILKNIYALASGIAHGLKYGDNFLSVLIANAADEMAAFLRKVGILNMDVGVHKESIPGVQLLKHPYRKSANYASSVYLGDLLVTCYSYFSRNRTFGTMIGKGMTVKAAQLEMNMVAEGYNASRAMFEINKEINADMPIANAVYRILWEKVSAANAFDELEETLI